MSPWHPLASHCPLNGDVPCNLSGYRPQDCPYRDAKGCHYIPYEVS